MYTHINRGRARKESDAGDVQMLCLLLMCSVLLISKCISLCLSVEQAVRILTTQWQSGRARHHPSSYEMPTVRFWRPYKADFSRDSQCVNPIKPYEVLNSRAIKKKKNQKFCIIINRSQPSQLRHLDTGFLTFTFKPFQLKIQGWSFWFWREQFVDMLMTFWPRIIDICSRVHKCSVMSSIQFF